MAGGIIGYGIIVFKKVILICATMRSNNYIIHRLSLHSDSNAINFFTSHYISYDILKQLRLFYLPYTIQNNAAYLLLLFAHILMVHNFEKQVMSLLANGQLICTCCKPCSIAESKKKTPYKNLLTYMVMVS